MNTFKGLYLIVSSKDCVLTVESMISQVIRAGVKIIQLREKNMTSREFFRLAKRVRSITEETQVKLIINDRIDIAQAVSADGAHLGQTDLPVTEARRILGRHAIIGVSVENQSQVLKANELPVDYIGISPVFVTKTKPELVNAWGLDGLLWCREHSTHPCIAIGGIDPGNCQSVALSGAHGIAVSSAICHSQNPTKVSSEIIREMEKVQSK